MADTDIMKALSHREMVAQPPSDESDSDDELFDYLNMSKKTEKQAEKELNKDDHREKKERITNIKAVDLNLEKDKTKASSEIEELSSIFTMVETTGSARTNEEGSVKTGQPHYHEPQIFFLPDVRPCHDEKGNRLLSAKVTLPDSESNSDEILMIQENSCLSDDHEFGNTKKRTAESNKSKEQSLNSTEVDMSIGKKYHASDNVSVLETNKNSFGSKNVANIVPSLMNDTVSEQDRDIKENEYHSHLQVYRETDGEEGDLTKSDELLGRKGISRSQFVEQSCIGLNSSQVNIKASCIELDNNPVHLPKFAHTYDRGKQTDEKRNEVFIPNMSKTPLPTQYKFVRNGNKLVRVAVVQEVTPDPDIVYDGVYDHQQTSNNNIEPNEDKQTHEQYTATVADINFDSSHNESVDDDSGFETGSGLYDTAKIDESCMQTGTSDIHKVQTESCQFVTTETDIVEKNCNVLMEDTDNINISKSYVVDSKNNIVKKTDSDFVEYFENACFSENASTSSRISLCSNESPIVLRVDPDGNLSECTKCPASTGITHQILQEKKTELDISFLSMKIQKIENDILEMKRVAEKSNEMKNFSQVGDKSEEKVTNAGEDEVNLGKLRMKDVDSQTEGTEMKYVVNNVDKTVEADKIYVTMKEIAMDTSVNIDGKKIKSEGNHEPEKEITEEAATETCTSDNAIEIARKCIPQKEKAQCSHMSTDNETKGTRKGKPQKKRTIYSSPNMCVDNKRRSFRSSKSQTGKAIDSSTNANDKMKTVRRLVPLEEKSDSFQSTNNETTMSKKCIPQKETAMGSPTYVDGDDKTKCLQQSSKKHKTCCYCNTVDDNEMLIERKHKPEKEIAESSSKNLEDNVTRIIRGRNVKKRKQPTASLNIQPKKKQKYISSLFSPKHFEISEGNSTASPKSFRGNNPSDEESQDDTDDYMIYNEEYLQKLYQHKLNEVRHIQNALKRMRQKSIYSTETQSETKTVTEYCTAESETEESVDTESNAKIIAVKKVTMGKKSCDTKRNCRKIIGSKMENVKEILSSSTNADLTSSTNLSTKSKLSKRLKGKSRKPGGTKRVTWSEKSNRTCEASPAIPHSDRIIDSMANLTTFSVPAGTDWKSVPSNEKRAQVNQKRSSKKSATIQSGESAVSELKDDSRSEKEHTAVCIKENKVPNRLDETRVTPDYVLKQNRKRKAETSCINTRKSVQVKGKSGQTVKEEMNTNDAGKEGNEKDVSRLNYPVDTNFQKSDNSSLKSENIEQKRNRLESIISEKLKAVKKTENVVNNQLKVDDRGQGSTKNKSHTCVKRKVSRKKVDRNIDTLKTKSKPQPKVSARKSRLRNVGAANKNNLNKDPKGQESKVAVKDARKQKSTGDQSAKCRKRAAGSTYPARLAFEKSCDYTWKEKLDLDSFSLNLQTKRDKAKRPLNVKKIIKKILVPKDSSGKKSHSSKKSKHLKRTKVAKSQVTPVVKGTFSDTDEAGQSDTAYMSDNNAFVVSFPGMKLCKEPVSPERLASRKEGSIDMLMKEKNEEMPVQRNKDMSIMGGNKRKCKNLGNEVSGGNTGKVSVSQRSVGHNKEHFEKTILQKSEKESGIDSMTVQENKNLCMKIHDSPSETGELEMETHLTGGKSNNSGETSQEKVNDIPQTSPASPRFMKTFDQIISLLDRRRKTCTRSTAQQQLHFQEES